MCSRITSKNTRKLWRSVTGKLWADVCWQYNIKCCNREIYILTDFMEIFPPAVDMKWLTTPIVVSNLTNDVIEDRESKSRPSSSSFGEEDSTTGTIDDVGMLSTEFSVDVDDGGVLSWRRRPLRRVD